MEKILEEQEILVRPKLFRALGREDPPLEIELEGRLYHRLKIVKHDSWAATAIYEDNQRRRVVCKFNRVQPVFIFPTRWLGKYLGNRETRAIRMMQDVEGFPHWAGIVVVDGLKLSNAVAHDWIEGREFVPSKELLHQDFFPRLLRMYGILHQRHIAHVDSSKWGNILVGEDDAPFLIDFQVHLYFPPGSAFRWLLYWFQAADLYHVYRNWLRVYPEQVPLEDRDLSKHRPGFLRFTEPLEPAWHRLRSWLLALNKVRPKARDRNRPTNPST